MTEKQLLEIEAYVDQREKDDRGVVLDPADVRALIAEVRRLRDLNKAWDGAIMKEYPQPKL